MAAKWPVTYNGAALQTGEVFSQQPGGHFDLSGISLVTFGLLYQAGDIWSPADDITAIVWTDTDCCNTCD